VTLNRAWWPSACAKRSWMSHATVPRHVGKNLRHNWLWFDLYESHEEMGPEESAAIAGTVACLAQFLTSPAEVAIMG